VGAAHAVATKSAKDEAAASRSHKKSQAVPEITPQTQAGFPGAQFFVQRKENACSCGGGCPRCQYLLPLQTKLAVSQPDDALEQEADRVAEQVLRMPQSERQNDPVAQRYAGLRLSRYAFGTSAQPSLRVPPIVHDVVRSPGEPLDPTTRAFMEPRFGHDFSSVRVHSGAAAEQSARAVDAKAYAVGYDIAFGAGRFAPGTLEGRRLIAHELAHVVQQTGGAAGSHRLSPAPLACARQGGPQSNPVLTPDEMFEIVVRERAWAFSPGGGAADVDPQGVGRGVGPAAGGKLAGHSVFAVIQVTDADGRPIALTYGEHISYSDPHAEARAVSGLRREIPAMRDVRGGKMTVVVDQIPCPPGRADCMGRLQAFAREKGLRLEVHLPTRQAMRGSNQVAPRTAAMSSQRTDVPRVSLTQYGPAARGPSTPGGAPHTPAVPAPASPAPRPTGAMRFTWPKPASSEALKARASLIASLKTQTQRSIRMNTRIKVISTGVSGVMGLLDTLSAIESGFKFAVHGTLFPEAEAMVDQVRDYGKEMVQWSNDVSDEISLVAAYAAIDDAERRDDSDTLFDIDSAFTNLSMQLSDKADYLRGVSTDLRAREEGLAIMKDFYGKIKYMPSMTTASNFEALAMEDSLGRLAGQMGNAAGYFEEAERLVRFYADTFSKLSKEANDRAWSINWERVAIAQREMDRERRLGKTLGRERRLNEIHAELERVGAQLNEPVSRLSEDIDHLFWRRDQLIREREDLLSNAPAP